MCIRSSDSVFDLVKGGGVIAVLLGIVCRERPRFDHRLVKKGVFFDSGRKRKKRKT